MVVCDVLLFSVFFFFKQKTAYEMRISDWSSDVCSSDLHHAAQLRRAERRGRDRHFELASGQAAAGPDDLGRGLAAVRQIDLDHLADFERRAAFDEQDRKSVV